PPLHSVLLWQWWEDVNPANSLLGFSIRYCKAAWISSLLSLAIASPTKTHPHVQVDAGKEHNVLQNF
ncbi:MAG: hypothetical protein C4322_16565, partial [Mastigocladus sp. ERB_26_1]